jgi:hypothetical protein
MPDGQPKAITTPEAEPSIPPDAGGSGTDVVEPELPSKQQFIQEPIGPEGAPFIPGFGSSSQPPLFQEQITSLPPEDTAVKDQPKVDTPPLTTSTSNACQISPGLCQHSFSFTSFIRRALDCSNISCKNIVFIQLYHPFKKPIAKPADIPLVSGIPKFVRPSVSIL